MPSILAAVVLAHQLAFAPAPRVDTTRLLFSPVAPVPGSQVDVRYRPAPGLEGEDVLRLRARFRTAGDESYNYRMQQVDAGVLSPAADGTFRGSFTLDSATVYAVFAVEDTSGARVDDNDRRLWDLLVHDPYGRSLEHALIQKSNDLMGRNWRAAYEAARLRRTLYPDSPDASMLLHFFQAQVLPPDSLQTALAMHRVRLAQFDEALRDIADVDPDAIARMMWYARGVEDSAVEARWKARLLAEAPTQTHALQERIVYDLLPAHREDPAGRLAALEGLWREADPDADEVTGPGYSYLLRFGLRTARELGDEEAERTWAERYRLTGQDIRLGPDTPWRVRAEIAELRSDVHAARPLTLPVPAWQRRQEAPLQRAFGRLGDLLLAAGDSAAALQAYEEAAARQAWDVLFFQRLARIYRDMRRDHAAIELLARVAADPAAAVTPDSLRKLAGDAVTEKEWSDLLSSARQRLHKLVLAEEVDRALPGDPPLADFEGDWTSLSSLSRGKPTVVAFWSRFCGPSLQALPDLRELARDLAAEGVQIVAITDEPPSADLAAFLEENELGSLTIRHDLRREASQTFNQWGTPSYFLLDSDGRLRFEYSTLDSLRRQVRVLQNGRRP